MFDKDLVEVGDILLYLPLKDNIQNTIVGDIITTLSYGGKYAHAAIYSDKKTNSIIESHAETGVVEKVLDEKWYSRIDIFRVRWGLSIKEQKALIHYMRRYELGKPYDLAAFPSSFFKATICQIFGWKNFKKCPPLLNDEAHRFCSELVAASYFIAIKKEICPGTDPRSVQPANLGKSPVLERIS